MELILTDEQKTTRGTIVSGNEKERLSKTVYQSAFTASCYEIIEGDLRPGYVIPSVEKASI